VAEIRVQPKPRSLAWLWALLALAVVGLVAWFLMRQGLVQVRSTPDTPAATTTAPTSAVPTASNPRS
jgi:hypothetical protein